MIGLDNTDTNDQGAFDAANNRFVAAVNGIYLFGATEIRGSLGEISATHVSHVTTIWLQTMVPLTAGDTVELQRYSRVADGHFAADHTSFRGCKVG